MTFRIEVNNVTDEECSDRSSCTIQIGEYKETFPLITTFWSVHEYSTQWFGAIQSLVENRVTSSILVTDIQHIEDSAGLCYWALFRLSGEVVMQNRFFRVAPVVDLFDSIAVEKIIPPRIQGQTQSQAMISEWTLPFSDFEDFIKRNKTKRKSGTLRQDQDYGDPPIHGTR